MYGSLFTVMKEHSKHENGVDITRRRVLRGLVAGGTALGVGTGVTGIAAADEDT
jgi:hypothetical protein